MIPAKTFGESALIRLQTFLQNRVGDDFGQIRALTPDASTREYFRVGWDDSTAIACVYPETFDPQTQSYLDVTRLFAVSGLPVAEVLAVDGALGVIVHEDFGDRILRGALETAPAAEREELIDQAVRLIAKIQAATDKAAEMDSVAWRLAFDFEKLAWELDFFTKHYFESLRGELLSSPDAADLKRELDEVARELAARPRVLTHRDFHAANLMLDRANLVRIIDHQDARMGAASYDLVSLLLDRVLEPPAEDWLLEKQNVFFNERERLGLPALDRSDFRREFELQTIQRCLKAIGTFSFQTAVRGRIGYNQYIQPMFAIVLAAAERLDRFPILQKIIETQLI